MEKFHEDVDFLGNEVRAMRIENVSQFPANARPGQVAYYTGQDRQGLHEFDGANWIRCSSSVPVELQQLNHVEVTYEQLTGSMWGYLEPGMVYVITDFETSCSLGGEWVPCGTPEPICVTAVGTSRLSTAAWSQDRPGDYLQYEPFFDEATHPKGKIVFRRDALRDVSAHFDWRGVRFRRWNAGGEASGAYTAWGSTYTQLGESVQVPDDSDHEDYYAFGDDPDALDFSGVSVGALDPALWTGRECGPDPNFVFLPGSKVRGVRIGDDSFDFTVGAGASDCEFGAGFKENSVGAGCVGNRFWARFNQNRIGSGFSSNRGGSDFAACDVGDGFSSNVVGGLFSGNVVGDGFQFNTVGDRCLDCRFGSEVQQNQIGNSFGDNVVGADSVRNRILLDGVSGVSFGTISNNRYDAGYSNLSVEKEVSNGVLDVTNEPWAGVVRVTAGGDVSRILYTSSFHDITVTPVAGVEVRFLHTSASSAGNGDVVLAGAGRLGNTGLRLIGDSGDYVVLRKDAVGAFRQVDGQNFRD